MQARVYISAHDVYWCIMSSTRCLCYNDTCSVINGTLRGKIKVEKNALLAHVLSGCPVSLSQQRNIN